MADMDLDELERLIKARDEIGRKLQTCNPDSATGISIAEQFSFADWEYEAALRVSAPALIQAARERDELKTELSRVEQVIGFADSPIQCKGRDLHNWLAQVLQVIITESGNFKTERDRLRKALLRRLSKDIMTRTAQLTRRTAQLTREHLEAALTATERK